MPGFVGEKHAIVQTHQKVLLIAIDDKPLDPTILFERGHTNPIPILSASVGDHHIRNFLPDIISQLLELYFDYDFVLRGSVAVNPCNQKFTETFFSPEVSVVVTPEKTVIFCDRSPLADVSGGKHSGGLTRENFQYSYATEFHKYWRRDFKMTFTIDGFRQRLAEERENGGLFNFNENGLRAPRKKTTARSFVQFQ